MWESVSGRRSIWCRASLSLVLLKSSRPIILLFVWHCCSCWLNDWKQQGSSLTGLSLCYNWWGSVINAVELDKLCGTWSPEVKAATLTSQKAGQTLSLGWARLDSLAPIYVMIQDASFLMKSLQMIFSFALLLSLWHLFKATLRLL